MRLCQCTPAYSSSCERIFNDHEDQVAPEQDPKAGTASVSKRKSSSSTLSNKDRTRLLDGWPCPLSSDCCDDDWTWNYRDGSHEAKLYGPRSRTVLFHPGWSNGTAAVRGTKPLLAPFQNGSKIYYWEIDVSHRVFGTSLMFGVGTKKADLHEYSFTNLLGKDEHSWALNHKGQIWHQGRSNDFTQPFSENTPTTISLILDWTRDDGVLEYYKDGRYLGVAFGQLASKIRGRSETGDDLCLYPMIASTAARTEMCLVRAKRKLTTLQDRCTSEIAKTMRSRPTDVDCLELPDGLKSSIRKRVLYSF